jgi:two-component system KDP operon response regulator KdpE
VVRARGEDAVAAFEQIEQNGQMELLLQQIDDRRMQPVTLQLGPQKDPLGPLFKSLRGQHLMLIPIMDSARFIGGIIASVVNSRQYSSEDAKLLAASLAHAAGLAVERTTIIQDILEKSSRLEALLRSTPQGIFFVDDGDHIAFCNPQFTELSGISPSEVLLQTPEVLLRVLSHQSDAPERVYRELYDAIHRVLDLNPEVHEEYPIVQIQMRNPERDILVEFMAFGESDGRRQGWAGIIREATSGQQMHGGHSELLTVMSERIRVPYAQIRGLLAMLNEQHSRFSHRERSRVLRQLEESIEGLGHQWENFFEMYNLEVSGTTLNRDEVDLYDIVQRVLESRAFTEMRRQVLVDAPARLPTLLLDETRIEIALANVLHNAASYSPRGAQITVKFLTTADEVRMIVHDQGIGIPADQQALVFEPFYQANNNTNEDGAGLGLYVSREILRRHGGEMWIESHAGQGTSVVMALPISGAEALQPINAIPSSAPAVRRADAVPAVVPELRTPASAGRRVSERPMQTIMLVEGRSTLVARLKAKMQDQGYELIHYRSGEEALRDVSSVRLDLIFLDVTLTDANGLDICERMCKRTEVPIIMLADEPSEAEKVRALMIGADDYIAQPIGDDELIARVNVIFKRRRIPDRTREPLDLGNLYIDFARREVFLNNKPLELTRIEYDLLHTLSVNQGQVLTHKQLLEKVWGPEYQAETQYLWVNVSRLRKKLEPTPDSPRYIHTQPGVGYVFRPS